MKPMSISRHMVRFPFSVNPSHSLAEAQEILRENNIRHLPVVSEQELVGILSDRDLKAAMSLDQAPTLTAGDIMKTDVYVVGPDTPLSEVACAMADEKIGSALIVDRESRLIGIFTTTDALRLLSVMLEDQSLEECLLEHQDFEDAFSMSRSIYS